jgi:hypothetical protein
VAVAEAEGQTKHEGEKRVAYKAIQKYLEVDHYYIVNEKMFE